MAKRATSFALMLPPRPRGTVAYRWLYESIKREILDGRLPQGTRLPGTRDLAGQHGLSRGTIVSAIDQLREEGYLEGSVGSGTYVSHSLPQERLRNSRQPVDAQAPSRQRRHLSAYASQVRNFHTPDFNASRCFRAHLPALELFPVTLWAQITSRRIRQYTTSQMIGCDPMGYPPLRESIANYLRTARGVRCDARQVLIVSGTQEALDIMSRLLVNPGDRVAIENPGYPGAARIFESLGARVIAVPVDDDGMVLRPSRLRDVRLAYVTPAHQFPTGVTLSLPRRLELIEWARATGALLFEDDYDSEYRYSGRPIPALQGLDRHGVVLFAGSLSKLLFPSLRLGYLVVPPDLVDHVATAKGLTHRHMPLLEQIVLRDFIEEGHFARHLRRMREVYAARLATLLERARERLDGLLDVSPIEAGLQTAAWLGRGITDATAVAAAAARDIEVTPLTRYTRGTTFRHGLMLGFASHDTPQIRRGVRELAIALEGAAAALRSG